MHKQLRKYAFQATKTQSQGLSVIEILVVLALIGVFLAVALPRFQIHNTEAQFQADISTFLATVSRAQSMAAASNSRSCAQTPNERLSRIDISMIADNTYQVVPVCADITLEPSDPTPTPNAKFITSHSPMASVVQFTGCDDIASECVFASFFPNGNVEVLRSVEFRRGAQVCIIDLSSTGVVTNSCD